MSSAFYPLFPLLIRWSAPLFLGNYVWAGLVIANVTGVAALYLFFRYVQEEHGNQAARFSLLGLLAFPTALFFSVIYTESLFWFESMVLFWAIRCNRIGWAATVAFLMPLTRAVGVFAAVVLVWHWFEQRKARGAGTNRSKAWLLVAGCGVLGWLAYLGLMWRWTDDPFEGFQSQKFYAYHPSIANIFNPQKWGAAFFQWRSFHDPMTSIMDRMCFVAFAGSLYGVWKLSRTHFVWALCVGLVPALSSCFFSYVRYTVCVFPLFILLGVYLSKPGRRWIFWYYVTFFLCLQGIFMVRYAAHWWAG